MEEVTLNDTESRYFGDLFLCCDVEKTGKLAMLKATEMFRSANLPNDVLRQIMSIANVPQTALHMSRVQFYSCLKLISAYQASIPLREEIISSSSIPLPLPKFSWKDTTDLVTTANNCDQRTSITTNEWRQSTGRQQHHHASSNSSSSNNVIGGTLELSSVRDTSNSDFPSTDSEVEHNDIEVQERTHRLKRSPEAWSTASDSPTPTNSVAERSWTKNNLWDGLLCEEQRELLGTEEESSDRHSSDDDDDGGGAGAVAAANNEILEHPETLESLYQITPEQRTYYVNQFKAVQPDVNKLISGPVAKIYFEKSRIPVKELRHIWQLCDVTRDGALSLNEFIAAMHLIVLRRNSIPVPSVLPAMLKASIPLSTNTEPPEADLLHLYDDKQLSNATTSSINSSTVQQSNRNSVHNYSNISSVVSANSSPQTIPTNIHQTAAAAATTTGSGSSPISLVSTGSAPISATAIIHHQHSKSNSSSSNTPIVCEPQQQLSPNKLKEAAAAADWVNQSSKEWTKFTESPTSSTLSSPGPKPVNFDMQRTVQAVGADPQILHPVPLRVTPVGLVESIIDEHDTSTAVARDFHRKSENLLYDSNNSNNAGIGNSGSLSLHVTRNDLDAINSNSTIAHNSSSKLLNNHHQYNTTNSTIGSVMTAAAVASAASTTINRETMQSDLRAIQRPQSKKLPSKHIGGLPPPPQRESSIGSIESADLNTIVGTANAFAVGKKDVPPPPPPRPHKHARSSSLDLNKFKLNDTARPEVRLSTTQASTTSATSATTSATSSIGNNAITSVPTSSNYNSIAPVIANSTNVSSGSSSTGCNDSSIINRIDDISSSSRNSIQIVQSALRSSAFEVYRKPTTHNQSNNIGTFYSPDQLASGGGDATINDHSSIIIHKHEKSLIDVMHQLKEQNGLLLRLCYDLSEELKTIKQKKEEVLYQLDAGANVVGLGSNNISATAGSSSTSNSSAAAASGNVTGHPSVV